MKSLDCQTEVFADDGIFPNSIFPVIIYRNVIHQDEQQIAEQMEEKFFHNSWTNSWRGGILSYHHYHSTAHEVLGVIGGSVILHLGGDQGRVVSLEKGDVVVIPAGVAHKNVHAEHLEVVGAYYKGKAWDLLRGEAGERPQADKNIAQLTSPEMDPVYGALGLPELWNDWAISKMI